MWGKDECVQLAGLLSVDEAEILKEGIVFFRKKAQMVVQILFSTVASPFFFLNSSRFLHVLDG